MALLIASLVTITVVDGSGTARAGSAPSRPDGAAERARRAASDLMGSRPHQIVLMENHKVLMSASSMGTSLITPVPLASISKAVTAMVIMRLVEEGSLTLDTALGDVLPPELVTDTWSSVTIEELLSHRSGFTPDRDRWFNSSYDACFEALSRITRRDEPVSPGSYAYSNTNFCALSLIVMARTGVSYEEATYRYLFRPLGIGRRSMDAEYVNLLGAGGWKMSALDTARVISALDPSSSLSPLGESTRRSMIDRTTFNYGLGVWIWDADTFGHSGTLYRARNIAVRLPSGRVVVILTQATSPESGLDLLPAAVAIDRAYGAACGTSPCPTGGLDPFLGDVGHSVRRTYF